MRSPMVDGASYIEDKGGYGEMQVLSSGAGYYVGTLYTNVEEDGTTWQEPGSRDSDYFRTHDEAQRFLDTVAALELRGALRESP